MLGDDISTGRLPDLSGGGYEQTAARPDDRQEGQEGGVPTRDTRGTPHPGPSQMRGGVSRDATQSDVSDVPHNREIRAQKPVSRPRRSDPPEGGGGEELTPVPTSQNGEWPHTNPSLNRAHCRNLERRCKKETKAAIRATSLNIRGYRSAGDGRNGSKWFHINQLIRDNRIGILAVQETHLTEERRDELEKLFSKRMKTFISKDPENPTGKAGVAIVLNRKISNVSGAKITEILPGRALLIQTNWHRAETISVLAVYAPNLTRPGENANFWKTLREYFTTHPRLKVDVLTGDLNMVEDMLDRLPAHNDPQDAVEELHELRNLLDLVDGWRTTFPTTKAYSFLQDATASQSRIDRIYVSPVVLQQAREWKIAPSDVPGADHKLVSVTVAHQEAPWVGKGRWSIPHHILKDKMFRIRVKQEGKQATIAADLVQWNRKKCYI
ncbi:hypothetical protein D9615_000307 [Tricholomella constricta]|uniref:Endonuclease/exonuclease/phosphatase domain-containing protein n=1 Tax=Tricholomella constricta TaxID=117010 RepID=A0A8H5HRY1_9AGAR|nr:hypothetical protein D9615_000307 [Tricholomella constricta]